MKRLLPTLLAVGALAASFASLSVEANTTRYTAYTGHQYQGIEINRTPSGAQTACANLGAHLVTFSDYTEWYDVTTNVASQLPGVNFWTGGRLPANTSTYTNVTGETYYNVPTQYNPAIYGGPFTDTFYLTVSSGNLGWYVSASKYYLCEWD